MRKRFDEQLNELNLEMQEMGRMVEDGIQKAIEALLKQDEALAQSVMEADALVDQKQKEIESICFKLLMQQQPVASDLRVISAALKMVTDMERIGDHAINIATNKNSGEQTLKNGEVVVEELATLKSLLEESFSLLMSNEFSADKFSRVDAIEDEIDKLTTEYRANQMKRLHDGLIEPSDCVVYTTVLSDIERVSDHVMNIGEELNRYNYYLLEAN